MNDWPLRLHYGRGAARVLVPLPSAPFETVPMRPGREVMASLSPFYLALLLAVGALLLEISGPTPAAIETASTIQLIAYEKPEAVREESTPTAVAASKSEPAESQPTGPRVTAATEAEPLPSSLARAPARISLALAAIEMDAFDDMLPAPIAAATRVRVASLGSVRPAGLSASDFDPIETEGPPPSFRAAAPANVIANAIALPAVSLPGPRAVVPTLAGVAKSGSGLTAPSRPLEGVQLEALAACKTRGREDVLKQELMLVTRSGTRCIGQGRSYSFLETKNLNAFLLRVAHDPGRELGNRCDELMRARVCVAAQHVAGVLP